MHPKSEMGPDENSQWCINVWILTSWRKREDALEYVALLGDGIQTSKQAIYEVESRQ